MLFLGIAPTNFSTGSPFLKAMTQGMLAIYVHRYIVLKGDVGFDMHT